MVLAWLVYFRGWRLARRTRPSELPTWRAVCFLLGIASLWLAIASPINALDDLLLTAHMTQHLLLMSVAPPLLVLGAPTVPLLRGLPLSLRRSIVHPLLRAKWARRTARILTHPAFGWLSMNVAYVAWHFPATFELALRSEAWHNVEHLCFFSTSLAFWWTVVQPWPSQPVWPRWAVIPYLLTADLVNTAVSASLAFSGRVLYPTYGRAPRVSNFSALKDQIAAGAGMWVIGSLIFLVAAVPILFKLLSPSYQAHRWEPSFGAPAPGRGPQRTQSTGVTTRASRA
jgi:putative membrane protein